MAFTVIQLIEKAGMPKHDLNLAIEYIQDALWEVQKEGDIDTHKTPFNIVADQRYYSLPSDMVHLKNVYGYNSDEEKYFHIPRALDQVIPDTDEEIGASISGDTNTYLFLLG